MNAAPDCDVTVVVATRDDEERIGHLLRRTAAHLRALRLSFELLVVDEGSGDNTLALLALVKRDLAELEVVPDAVPGRGLSRGAELARGRALVLLDATTEPPLAALGFALHRLGDGCDVVAVAGRALVLRRLRTWRAFDALHHHRDMTELQRRFLRRARSLDLATHATPRASRPAAAAPPWRRLRALLLPALREPRRA